MKSLTPQEHADLNIKIAEIMGYVILKDDEKCPLNASDGATYYQKGQRISWMENHGPFKEYWSPSRNMNDAMELYNKMLDKPDANRWVLVERKHGLPCAKFYWNDSRPDTLAEAVEMATAICLTAVKATQHV